MRQADPKGDWGTALDCKLASTSWVGAIGEQVDAIMKVIGANHDTIRSDVRQPPSHDRIPKAVIVAPILCGLKLAELYSIGRDLEATSGVACLQWPQPCPDVVERNTKSFVNRHHCHHSECVQDLPSRNSCVQFEESPQHSHRSKGMP